jgi:hypothetical protein
VRVVSKYIPLTLILSPRGEEIRRCAVLKCKVCTFKKLLTVKKNWCQEKLAQCYNFNTRYGENFLLRWSIGEISRNYRRPFKKPLVKKWRLN